MKPLLKPVKLYKAQDGKVSMIDRELHEGNAICVLLKTLTTDHHEVHEFTYNNLCTTITNFACGVMDIHQTIEALIVTMHMFYGLDYTVAKRCAGKALASTVIKMATNIR